MKASAFYDKKTFGLKNYQIEKYKKQKLDIIVVDYETKPGILYFAWFNINKVDDMIDETKSRTKVYDNKGKSECKVWKTVDLHGEELHMINFKKAPSSKNQIIDTVFKLDKQNDNTIFIDKDSPSKTFSKNKIKIKM